LSEWLAIVRGSLAWPRSHKTLLLHVRSISWAR